MASNGQKKTKPRRRKPLVSPRVIAAQKEFDAEEYRAALKICEDVYVSDASNVDNLLLLGAIHFQLRNISESTFYIQQCLRVEPDCAEAHCLLGNCFKELRDLESAHNCLSKAVRIQPRLADAYCNLASVQLQMGRPVDAIESLEIAISLDSAHSDALSNLGNVLKVTGRPDDAKKRYREAIRVNPECSIAWSGLGGLLHDCGEHEKAIESYRQATKLAPKFADAHSNLGNSLRECSMSTNDPDLIQEAKATYRTALELRHDFAPARSNLALCHLDDGEIDLAIQQLRMSVLQAPNCADALSNLAGLYLKHGNIDNDLCIKLLIRALRIKPNHSHAHNNLGIALYRKGILKEGLHCFVTASQISKHPVVLNNIGVLFFVQGKASVSAKYLRQAIAADPHFINAYTSLGNVYLENGKLDHAEKCYRIVLETSPRNAQALMSLALVKQAGGNFDEAYAYSKKAVELSPESDKVFATHMFLAACCCDWTNRAEDVSRLKSVAEKAIADCDMMCPVQPFHASCFFQDVMLLRQLSQLNAQRAMVRALCHRSAPFHHEAPNGSPQKVKLGYVGSLFGCTVKSLLDLHDKNEFQVLWYKTSLSPIVEDIDSLLGIDHCKDISGLSDGAAAEEINSDGVDILIDLNGYTAGARTAIFALKPAPVQIVFSRHCGTMGASFIDYSVADDTAIPKEHYNSVAENVIYVPNTMNNCRSLTPLVLEDDFDRFEVRSTYGILDDVFVYASFALPYQIDPMIFDSWLNILASVEDSILLLVSYSSSSEAALKNEAERHGVEPKRLVFLDFAQEEEECTRRCCIVDLFLDAYAYDFCMWAGTPMISILGDSLCGVNLLKSKDLDDLVVEDIDSYQRLAVSLSTDDDRYMNMWRSLNNVRSESDDKWMICYEGGLKEVWRRRWQEG